MYVTRSAIVKLSKDPTMPVVSRNYFFRAGTEPQSFQPQPAFRYNVEANNNSVVVANTTSTTTTVSVQKQKKNTKKDIALSDRSNHFRVKNHQRPHNITSKKKTCTTKQEKVKKNVGRWDHWERLAFLEGLRRYGRGRWKKISDMIPTRDTIQVKTHAKILLKKLDEGYDIFKDLDMYNNNHKHNKKTGDDEKSSTSRSKQNRDNAGTISSTGSTRAIPSIHDNVFGQNQPTTTGRTDKVDHKWPAHSTDRISAAKALLLLSESIVPVFYKNENENSNQEE